MKSTLCLVFALALVLPAFAKLTEAAMKLPDSLAAAERLPVKGRQGWKRIERLEFGDCKVHDVERSLTKGSDLFASVPGLAYEGSKRRQTFGFKLSEADASPWRGAAATNLHRRALEAELTVEFRNQSGFIAVLSSEAEPDQSWTLSLAEKRERPLEGTLKRAECVVAVKGTDLLAGTPLPLGETSGYVFEVDGQPVAAVEVINNGAVWIASDLAPNLRAPVTAAISSLLLFEELRKTLPE